MKFPSGGGGLAAPTIPVPAKFRAFSDFCITEQWKFHLACLRNKDDAPRWIQDNYAKNGKVGFYEDSIWRYIPKAIISVCCDGNSDISPGAQPAEFRQQNWNALLLKKSIAQCQKYLQSGKELGSILRDVLDTLEESVDEKVCPMREELDSMQKEVDKKVLRFVKDEAKKYGLTTELPPLQKGEYFFFNDYKYWQRYFKKIGRPKGVDDWIEHMSKLKFSEKIMNAEDRMYEVVIGCFIKLAADELKNDEKYRGFASDIDAAFNDVVIYTETLDIFQFVRKCNAWLNDKYDKSKFPNKYVAASPEGISRDDDYYLNGYVKASSGTNLPEMQVVRFVPSSSDKPTLLGHLALKERDETRHAFFKNFPKSTEGNSENCCNWNDLDVRSYCFNGMCYYKIGSQVVELDDKMNFVRLVDKVDTANYDVSTCILNQLKRCRINFHKTWNCSRYYSADDLDELFPQIDEKLGGHKKIKNDIEALTNDKSKTKELDEYKIQLGRKRAQELFWMLFENKRQRENIEMFMCHDAERFIGLMKQIKKSGLMSDYDFLDKQAIELGEITAVPLSIGGYGSNKSGQTWVEIGQIRCHLCEVNSKLFFQKALSNFFDEFERRYLKSGVDREVVDFIDCIMDTRYVYTVHNP